jgi:hypothetical protein
MFQRKINIFLYFYDRQEMKQFPTYSTSFCYCFLSLELAWHMMKVLSLSFTNEHFHSNIFFRHVHVVQYKKKTTTLSIRRMNEISKPVKWRENRKNSISRIENDSKRITLKEMKISYMRGTMTTCVLPFLYVVCELWIVECWVKNRVFSRDENGIFLSHFVTWKVEGWYTFVLIYYAFVTFGFYSIFINASLFYTWCQNFQIRPAIALFNSYSHPRNTTSHMTNLQNFWQLSSFQVHTSVWGKSQKDVH